MTLIDALMLTGSIPDHEIRQLCVAATDVAIAEIDHEQLSTTPRAARSYGSSLAAAAPSAAILATSAEAIEGVQAARCAETHDA